MRRRRAAGIGFVILVLCCGAYVTFNFNSRIDVKNYGTPREKFRSPILAYWTKSAPATRLATAPVPAAPVDTALAPPLAYSAAPVLATPIGTTPVAVPHAATPAISKGTPVASCLNGTVGPVLTSLTAGRLGNQMYMYATMFAELEKAKGQRSGIVNPEMFEIISTTFNLSLPTVDLKTYNNVGWTVYNFDSTIDKSYPTEMELPTVPPCVQIYSSPQQWQLFDSFRSSIRREFKFHDHIAFKVKQILSNVKQSFFKEGSEVNVTLIGVHVRRTDYVGHSKFLKLYFPEIPFYQGAMKKMAEKYENPIFIIASDDIAYCKRQFKTLESSYKIFYSTDEKNSQSDGSIAMDMATLAHCDHVIFGVGTFGFWAGYLCGGDVVYCACAKSDSQMREMHKFFLPSWTGISVGGDIARTPVS